MRSYLLVVLPLMVLLRGLTPPARVSAADPPTGTIVLRDYLVLPGVVRGGRSPVFIDALQAQRLRGTPAAPKAGDTVALPGGRTVTWEAAQAKPDGLLQSRALRGGYARTTVTVDADRVMILEASGQSSTSVNGEPRAGDPYSYGYVHVPVLLKKGANELLFQVGRGRLQAKLVPPPATAYLDLSDLTTPDVVLDGERPKALLAGVVVVNASIHTVSNLTVRAMGFRSRDSDVPPLPPLSVRKVRVALDVPLPDELKGRDNCEFRLELRKRPDGGVLNQATLKLRVRKPGQSQKRTFISAIDGSVQYYAIQPARIPPSHENQPAALVLSLHGAGVEAIGQADAYAPNSWAHIVCPTNRRPYGFDWEDWGRWDALEVLQIAQQQLHTDPERTYLTGHSMGGHGAWQLGVLFPDRFAAVGPSAGWPEFALYGGGRRPNNPPPVLDLVLRAGLPSETRRFARNLAQEGVYILHGDKDDNVPVRMARLMRDELTKLHIDFSYHEQPGAGHWWSVPNSAGAACVNWPAMFDLFAHRVRPGKQMLHRVEFVTPAPVVSSKYSWARIWQQRQAYRPSSINLDRDLATHRLTGQTENVACLSVDLTSLPAADWKIELDGQSLTAPKAERTLWLARHGDRWEIAQPPSPNEKGPSRAGPFKEAFRNRMMFVYGTAGTPKENAWAFAKARFDAETFWYRGNGSIDVIPDTAFDAAATKDRNVILYGHADMNRAWAQLLEKSPIQVHRNSITVGDRTEMADDLACLFVRPRPNSHTASVGVVAGTGLPGLRLTNHLPVFISGVAYPDWIVMDSSMLTKGAEGLRGAGFFGNDWSLKEGESVWR